MNVSQQRSLTSQLPTMNNTTALEKAPTKTNHFPMMLFKRLVYSYSGMHCIYVLLGSALCVWWASAILTSRDMRRRLRNQLVCLTLISMSLKVIVAGTIEMVVILSVVEGKVHFNCFLDTFAMIIRNVLEFAAVWLLVVLLAVLVAQLSDVDPSASLTPRAAAWGRAALMTSPFVGSAVTIPVVAYLLRYDVRRWPDWCIVRTLLSYHVMHALEFLIPAALCVILLVVAGVKHYRRFHRGAKTDQAVLMSRGVAVDGVLAYVAVVVINVVCFLPYVLIFVELGMDLDNRLKYNFISWMLVDGRSILVPWAWLLLPDVRERIKTWRPWYRPAPGIDLTVRYRQGEE